MYRVFYFTTGYHRGVEYRKMERTIISDLKLLVNYEVYYVTDINGNIIVDNRGRYDNV